MLHTTAEQRGWIPVGGCPPLPHCPPTDAAPVHSRHGQPGARRANLTPNITTLPDRRGPPDGAQFETRNRSLGGIFTLSSMPPDVLSEQDAIDLLSTRDPVDVLIGIPSFKNAKTIGHVVRAVEAGLRKYFPNRRCLIVVSDGDSNDGTCQAALAATTEGDEERLLLEPKSDLPDKLAFTYTGLSGKGSAFRAIFEVAKAVDARACAVFDADLRSVSPEWVD